MMVSAVQLSTSSIVQQACVGTMRSGSSFSNDQRESEQFCSPDTRGCDHHVETRAREGVGGVRCCRLFPGDDSASLF